MPLAVDDLTVESFAAFGRVVDAPERRPDATGAAWLWWAETALLETGDRPYAVGYLELAPGRPVFDWAESHARSEEMVIPVQGEILVYAAAPEPRDFHVFRVARGQAVILDKNVWHGDPLATDGPARAIVLLAEGTGERDTDKVQFEELAVEEGR
jgi:ureidoglycolate hydrolase